MKYMLTILFLSLTMMSWAQSRLNKKHRPSSAYLKQKKKEKKNPGAPMPFADSQMWLGLKGGVNSAKTIPTKRYAVFESTQSSEASKDFEKQYDSFGQLNFQFGLVATYSFNSFLSLSLQPTYSNLYFSYKNQYQWAGQANNYVELKQNHRFQLTYLELPLLVKFDMLHSRFRPYVQGGAFYGRLIKAEKFIATTSLDNASGAVNPLENTTPNIGARELFIRSNWGLLAGAGFSYDIGNVRVSLEGIYKMGRNNITNEKNRYTVDQLTGVGDVMDGMKLRNIECYITVLFPMKFLQKSGFNKVDP